MSDLYQKIPGLYKREEQKPFNLIVDRKREHAANVAEANCLRATISLLEYHHKKIMDELNTKLSRIDIKLRYESEIKGTPHAKDN